MVRPADSGNMTTKTVWVPPGTWVEEATGALLQGAQDGSTKLTKQFDLSEIPLFVRAGAIIPRIPVRMGDTIGLAQRAYTTLQLDIYPGATSGSTMVYEDDGATMNYLNGSLAWTKVSYTRTATSMTVTIRSGMKVTTSVFLPVFSC